MIIGQHLEGICGDGVYQLYAESIKGKHKQEIDEKKEAIRAEDIARGVFVPVAMMPKLEPQRAKRGT